MSPGEGKLGADLDAFLAQFTGQRVVYCANPGNGGDSIIALSTFQKFRALNIAFDIRHADDLESDLTGRTVLYAGGGNLAHDYTSARRFFATHHRSVDRLVLLPHTIVGQDDLLAELGGNVDLILRDLPSFEHVAKHAPRARRHLMHDVGFSLDLDDLRRLRPSARDLSLKHVRRLLKLELLRWRLRAPTGSVLNCHRTDGERTNRSLATDNIDVSSVFNAGVAPEIVARLTVRAIVGLLGRYEEIRTNRLHMAVAGALLGKRVILSDNSYGKNRRVFEHSMVGRFPNVIWDGRDAAVG